MGWTGVDVYLLTYLLTYLHFATVCSWDCCWSGEMWMFSSTY